jgi:hypothetical protein
VTPVEPIAKEYARLILPGSDKEIRLPILQGAIGPKLIDVKKLYN